MTARCSSMTPAFACSRTARRSVSDDEVRKTAILTRETPRVIRDLHFAQGIANADPARPHGAAAGRRAGVAGVRPDPLPGRAVRLPVADRRRPVADRRRLRGGGAHARPRSARRCTAATNWRSRSGSWRCGCSSRCSATTPRSARRRPTSSPPATCWSPGATVGVLAMRRIGEPEAELGAAERARLGLALDQFRRTLPRRQALSTVHGRPRRAGRRRCSERGEHRRARPPGAGRARRGVRRRGPRDHRLQRAATSTCATPTGRTSTPAWRCASLGRSPSMAHPLVGRVSAPTGCSPARPRRRTPAS